MKSALICKWRRRSGLSWSLCYYWIFGSVEPKRLCGFSFLEEQLLSADYIVLEGCLCHCVSRWTVTLWVGFVLLATLVMPIVLDLFYCQLACVPLSDLSFL